MAVGKVIAVCVDERALHANLELALCWCAGGASVDIPQGGHRVQVVGGDEGLGVGILGERVGRRGEQGVGGEVIDAGQVLLVARRAEEKRSGAASWKTLKCQFGKERF